MSVSITRRRWGPAGERGRPVVRDGEMIGWLKGGLIARTLEGELLVDVGGVGYRVSVPSQLLASVGEQGEAIALHVHTHVREDAIVLFGFRSAEERRCFEALLSAHGVGP